jgi:integrase
MQPDANRNSQNSMSFGSQIKPGAREYANDAPIISRVSKIHRPDRASPHLVQWGRGQDRRTESFKTPEEQEARYAEISARLERNGDDFIFNRQAKIDYAAFMATIGDASWVDVVAGWRENLKRKEVVRSSKTVGEAAAEYIANAMVLRDTGQESPDTFRQQRHKISILGTRLNTVPLCEVTTEMMEQLIKDLFKELGLSENGTFNNYLKSFRTFFNANSKHVTPNPTLGIPLKDDSIDEVGVLTPKEMAQLFAYAMKHRPDALGRLALEAFAGLRFSSAAKIAKEEIKFDDKGITLAKRKLKTRRRHYIDGLPDNTWAWADKATTACWKMKKSDWMHMKSDLFMDAGVPHPHNCLRHSFATYHVAAFKNPGLTATLLCHHDQAQLWAHYNGIASKAAGITYFSITPENAEQIAAG